MAMAAMACRENALRALAIAVRVHVDGTAYRQVRRYVNVQQLFRQAANQLVDLKNVFEGAQPLVPDPSIEEHLLKGFPVPFMEVQWVFVKMANHMQVVLEDSLSSGSNLLSAFIDHFNEQHGHPPTLAGVDHFFKFDDEGAVFPKVSVDFLQFGGPGGVRLGQLWQTCNAFHGTLLRDLDCRGVCRDTPAQVLRPWWIPLWSST